MIGLELSRLRSEPLTILCLGAHSDDIEIGCGGTLLRLLVDYPDARIHWAVLSAEGERGSEARRGAALFAGDALEPPMIHTFPDGYLPYHGARIKDFFEAEVKTVSPDLVFTHNRDDAHQDHRLVAELTYNTFRNHLILEYEIPKADGDMGRPSVFFPLDAALCERKIDCLVEAFESQSKKDWFDRATFLALMRLRGMECKAVGGYAEAFYCRKMVL